MCELAARVTAQASKLVAIVRIEESCWRSTGGGIPGWICHLLCLLLRLGDATLHTSHFTAAVNCLPNWRPLTQVETMNAHERAKPSEALIEMRDEQLSERSCHSDAKRISDRARVLPTWLTVRSSRPLCRSMLARAQFIIRFRIMMSTDTGYNSR